MPFLTVGDGTRLYYQLEGNDDRPVLIFSHSLGADHSMWEPQAAALVPYFRILRYDMRGHGASAVPPGEYTLERLGQDVLDVTDQFGFTQFAFCGISLGGMIGQWAAARTPERLTQLILANTSPKTSPPSLWDERRRTVLERGMASIADLMMERYFSPDTLARKDPRATRVRRNLLGTHPGGYAGCCSAIRDTDNTGLLREIRTPTLVIGSEEDPSLPWTGHSDILVREIPGAMGQQIPGHHLSNLDRPSAFNAALTAFLLPAPDPADTLAAGYRVRREVLGDAFIDATIGNTTDFNRDFDELLTRYAWGSVWTRPGLDHRTRRLLVLAVTAALRSWEQYRVHLRSALAAGPNGGLEDADVRELLLQLAIYAGIPAAYTGFSIAREELARGR